MGHTVPSKEEIQYASGASFRSRAVIERSSQAGCFYCAEIFPTSEITEWTDDEQTPICPRCGIDAVLGDASGYPLEKKFLEQLHKERFGEE